MARGRKKGLSPQERRRRQLQSTYDRLHTTPVEDHLDRELRADYYEELKRMRVPKPLRSL